MRQFALLDDDELQSLMAKDPLRAAPEPSPRTPGRPESAPSVFHAGYQGLSLETFILTVRKMKAMVFDIRLMPRARGQGWNDYQLRTTLLDQYHSCKEWGNVNYKSGGPIQIADIEAGYRDFHTTLWEGRPIILLCVCRDFETCHRKVIADYLQEKHGIHCVKLDI